MVAVGEEAVIVEGLLALLGLVAGEGGFFAGLTIVYLLVSGELGLEFLFTLAGEDGDLTLLKVYGALSEEDVLEETLDVVAVGDMQALVVDEGVAAVFLKSSVGEFGFPCKFYALTLVFHLLA